MACDRVLRAKELSLATGRNALVRICRLHCAACDTYVLRRMLTNTLPQLGTGLIKCLFCSFCAQSRAPPHPIRIIYDEHPPPKMTLDHTKADQDYAIGQGDPPL